MKRHFGTTFTRLLGGGASLTLLEYQVICGMLASLPPWLAATANAQLDAYNLVQREVNGRTLNFYRKLHGSCDNMTGLPTFDMQKEEAPLVGVTFRLADNGTLLHATMTAVRGRLFCVSFDRALHKLKTKQAPIIETVRQSWRSNFLQNRA